VGVVKTLVDTGMIPSIVKLASKPTNFSQKWRLAELEVLGMTMYKVEAKAEVAEAAPTEPVATPTDEDKEEEAKELTPEQKNAKILEGLPDEATTILQVNTLD